MNELIPHSLKGAPALIEAVFPAQKVSFEAQRERKAGPGQTLTSLGSYWKGRKPLILVRSIVLGSLLPQTDDREKDLETFELLMGFDQLSLAKRAMMQNIIKPKDIAANIELPNPWDFFSHNIKPENEQFPAIAEWTLPIDAKSEGVTLRWQRNIEEADKLHLIGLYLETKVGYEAKAEFCKRPEELDQAWLYEHVWPLVNKHYAYLGIKAESHQELVDQLGLLRYGHRPRVGDTFCGGGSIPFEAARLGCDVYASDLNPIACMLTWGALNIIGATKERREEIEAAQKEIARKVDEEITQLGIEHDAQGNRAKAYLYCLETRCPQTGWLVPLSSSWVVSPRQNTVAKLIPDYEKKSFNIEITSGVTNEAVSKAKEGTLQDGSLVYEIDGKTYRTSIKTIRGDYKDQDGSNKNRLRRWGKLDFKPRKDDIFQERLYAIHWITRETLGQSRQETFFTGVSIEDMVHVKQVEQIVADNIEQWQEDGLIPDMEIEPGDKTDEPIRTRGWTHWHHLFSARDLIKLALMRKASTAPYLFPELCGTLDFCSKLSRWIVRFSSGGGSDFTSNVFSNQALNTLYNWAERSFIDHDYLQNYQNIPINSEAKVFSATANKINEVLDLYITDPPYADAVHYHEITEFFIAWLRKNPPKPFDEWVWDSRRALAIKGSGDDFRKGMIDAYTAMANHMPDNGMQCVMFTHQDTSVWSDMVGIFWAAGLQVVAAWYIATETTSELKKGGYVQGTVTLMLRKRPPGDNVGFKSRILPAVRTEVQRQIESMMHLNDDVKDKMGEPVFNDSDLQMAGYAAALKVLTAYTEIGGEDVTAFALKPRIKGEVTVVDEIVQQAAEAANSLLIPEGLKAVTWQKLSGIQRFYLRMMDIETTGASKLDNYQNFAKAFRVDDYTRVMGSIKANGAHLTPIAKFESRDLTDSTEIGATWLGQLAIGLQQLLSDVDPQQVIRFLQEELPDFMEARPCLIDILNFIEKRSLEPQVRAVAETLGARLKNMRALGQ